MTRRQQRYAENRELERARNREQYRKHAAKRRAAARARHAANKARENARCRDYYARTYTPTSSRRRPTVSRLIRASDEVMVRNHEYRERELQAALETPELRELVQEQLADDRRLMIAKPWERSLFERPFGNEVELIDLIAA